MAQTIVTTFGICVILELITAMNDGYVALCIYNGTTCIVKYIAYDPLYGIDKKVLRELNTLKKVDHPNIVKLHYVDYDSKGIYLFLENCGKNLLHWNIDDVDKITVMHDLTNAISYLHEMGIYHGDISLANIMIDMVNGKQVCKLIDFGNSSKIERQKNVSIPTLYIAPPEILLDSVQAINPIKLDSWAIGVVCHYIITGLPLFTGDTIGNQRKEIVNKLGVKQDSVTSDASMKINITEAFTHKKYRQLSKFKKLLNIVPSKRPSLKKMLSHFDSHTKNKSIKQTKSNNTSSIQNISHDAKLFLANTLLELNNNNNISTESIYITFALLNCVTSESTNDYLVSGMILYYMATKLISNVYIDISSLQSIISYCTSVDLTHGEIMDKIYEHLHFVDWTTDIDTSYISSLTDDIRILYDALYLMLSFNKEFDSLTVYDKKIILKNITFRMLKKIKHQDISISTALMESFVTYINTNIEKNTVVAELALSYLSYYNANYCLTTVQNTKMY
jgi:hypothetical protein